MITIRDILALKNFSNFRLVAGEKGLDRMVLRGGFIDHEEIGDFKGVTLLDEMIFSNLPMIKGHPEKIVGYVDALIESRTSCLAIKTTIFKEIPQDAIDLANEKDYPLFLFDEVFIDKLILEIDELVNDRKLLSRQLTLLEEVEKGNIPADEIKNHTFELNKYFKKYLQVCIIKKAENSEARFDVKIAKQLLSKHDLIIPVENYFIMILSSDNKDTKEHVIIKLLDLKEDDYHIGTSRVSENLDKLIYESKTALKYARFKEAFFYSYDSIGVYKVLFPIFNQPYAESFYAPIVSTLTKHDEVNQSELLQTLIAYVNLGGDIKKTASSMYQHDNTVRYRLRKINSLLDDLPYETLAIAVHLYELNENKSKFEPL